MKKRRNSALEWNLLGALSTGPRPPALPVIHHRSRRPMPSMKGAPMPSDRNEEAEEFGVGVELAGSAEYGPKAACLAGDPPQEQKADAEHEGGADAFRSE